MFSRYVKKRVVSKENWKIKINCGEILLEREERVEGGRV